MELPFLKNKQKQGGGGSVVEIDRTSDQTSDKALLEGIADELLAAIEKNDIKAFREALSAFVLSITDKDQE